MKWYLFKQYIQEQIESFVPYHSDVERRQPKQCGTAQKENKINEYKLKDVLTKIKMWNSPEHVNYKYFYLSQYHLSISPLLLTEYSLQ